MRKLIIFFLIALSVMIIYAQSYNEGCTGKGQCDLPKNLNVQAGLGDQATMIMQQSVDPNELEGPMGVDSVRWVSKNDVLNYTVFFENDPEFATAHAQVVDISIDMADGRLLNDFKLGAYTFANRSFEMPNEPNFYSMRLDCRDSLGIYVDVVAGMDVEKKNVFWKLSSIDPETEHAPWQVDKGLLPVNDSTHIGEGFVTFRLKPFEEMQTGDSIGFLANILFDSNDTIQTNRWYNLIDAGAPKSTVKASVDTQDYSHYRLSFQAEDDKGGCGVGKVFLYLADNLGNYEEYAACPVDSILDFYVEKGKQYRLMSIGEDRVGNRESVKTEPDLILNFNLPPTDLNLSNTAFRDDIENDGFIGELSAVDTEGETEFTYALAEGEGAVHNEMFAVVGNRLQANACFKCSEIVEYSVRLSVTDAGGLSFSKPFRLDMARVLEKPEPKTLDISICEGDEYEFHGERYSRTGTYTARVENEFMCDSIYTLNLRVNPIPEPPTVTVSGKCTLVSSAETGNQWYKDGNPIDGAEEKSFTATESGLYSVTASNGSCESSPSDEYYVNLDVSSGIDIELGKGWNWFSSNTDDASVRKPEIFFKSALPNIKSVRGAAGSLDKSGSSLSGTLQEIVPATYKILMASPGRISLNADPVDPEQFPVSLVDGWNWIPYIPSLDLSVETAFSSFTPAENDVVKSQTQFAVYSDGAWNGTLKEMHPGEGYMYYTTRPTTMKYSSSRVTKFEGESSDQPVGSQWSTDPSAYPDNMTIVAELMENGVRTMEGAYTVLAYCGKECRGVGHYDGGLIYITVHGKDGNDIKFKAVENVTGVESDVNETIQFIEDPVGTPTKPYTLTIGSNTSIDGVETGNDLNIYPNPVRDRMYITGDVSNITGVKIISTDGVIMISEDEYREGVDVTTIVDGVYIAALITPNGVIYRKFVKKEY